jgi:hypothetical protein
MYSTIVSKITNINTYRQVDRTFVHILNIMIDVSIFPKVPMASSTGGTYVYIFIAISLSGKATPC